MAAPTESAPHPPHACPARLGVGAIVFMVVAAAAPLTVIAGTAPLGIAARQRRRLPGHVRALRRDPAALRRRVLRDEPRTCRERRRLLHLRRLRPRPPARARRRVPRAATYTTVQVAVTATSARRSTGSVTSSAGRRCRGGSGRSRRSRSSASSATATSSSPAKVLGVLLIAEVAHRARARRRRGHRAAARGPLDGVRSNRQRRLRRARHRAHVRDRGFIGFEATAIFRDEAHDPHRTIPRATYVALIIIGVFYTLSCWAHRVGVGRRRPPSRRPRRDPGHLHDHHDVTN